MASAAGTACLRAVCIGPTFGLSDECRQSQLSLANCMPGRGMRARAGSLGGHSAVQRGMSDPARAARQKTDNHQRQSKRTSTQLRQLQQHTEHRDGVYRSAFTSVRLGYNPKKPMNSPLPSLSLPSSKRGGEENPLRTIAGGLQGGECLAATDFLAPGWGQPWGWASGDGCAGVPRPLQNAGLWATALTSHP